MINGKDVFIDLDTKYWISDEFVMRNIAGKDLVIPINEDGRFRNEIVIPNETAVFLWNSFLHPTTITQVIARCKMEYESEEEEIERAVVHFVWESLMLGVMKGEKINEKEMD